MPLITIDDYYDINFYNELNDMPNEARQYGMAGWTKDENFLVYDRYDIWQIDPSGKEKPTNLTQGKGRDNTLRLRYKKLDRDEKYLPDNMLLSVLNEANKKAGYYSLDSKKGELTELIYGDYNFRKIIKAKDDEQVARSHERKEQAPPGPQCAQQQYLCRKVSSP